MSPAIIMRETLETIRASLKVDDPHGHYDLVCNALAEQPRPALWQHIANQWAEELCNALQALRNVRAGIATASEAEDSIQEGIHRCRALQRPKVAEKPTQVGENRSPEDEAEQFIQAAIDRAPEPLRRLGEYLTRVLDEDEWKAAERMLLGAAEQSAQGEAVGEVTHRILSRGCHAECAGDMGVVYYPGNVLPVGTKLYTAPPAPSVPQRQAMVAMVDAAMVEMSDIHPPLKRSECERLIRAAIRESGGKTSVPDDASRYRWLREGHNGSDIVGGYLHAGDTWLPIGAELDAAIDAAMLAAAPSDWVDDQGQPRVTPRPAPHKRPPPTAAEARAMRAAAAPELKP